MKQRQGTGTRVVYAITANYAYVFLKNHLSYIRTRGFYPVVITGGNQQEIDDGGDTVVSVPMTRDISPIRDFVSLLRLWVTMRRLRPAISNVSTPKAGLLAGLASVLAGVPRRIYTLRGLRFETTKGLKRKLLVTVERIACRCSHRVIAVSYGVRTRAIENGIVEPGKIVVLNNGSSDGVDTSHYAPQTFNDEVLDLVRSSLSLPKGSLVLGFVGRLTRDKGVRELLSAFRQLRDTWGNLYLLLVGDFETGDPVDTTTYQAIRSDPHVIVTGFVKDTAPYYHLMDMLALPTHREGFPNVVLEAQATGLPVVTTTATGAVESVVNGITGLLVPVGDPVSLAKAIGDLLKDRGLRLRMGQAGRQRAQRDFIPEMIWDDLLAQYKKLLGPNQAIDAKNEQPIPATFRSCSFQRSKNHDANRLHNSLEVAVTEVEE